MRNPRHKRLAKEHIALEQLSRRSDVISYEIVGDINPVPSVYLVHYKLKSIIGLDKDFYPVIGSLHSIQITLTNNYPVEPARCYAKTDLWHPNIKYKGKHKGKICSNTKEFGKLFSLDLLALRIGEMLQYKNYHAKNIAPYPEDEEVAKWVREFAEPQDIINYDKGIVIDESLLINPALAEQEPEIFNTPKDKPEENSSSKENSSSTHIRIKKSRPANTGHIKFKRKDTESKETS